VILSSLWALEIFGEQVVSWRDYGHNTLGLVTMKMMHDPCNLDVLRAYLANEFDTKEWFDLKTEAERLALFRGFDRLISLDTLQIELYDHQREAALRVLRDMRSRALLADEVGLGKTIEAGVVMKEYLLRGLARRVLILTPASLVSQWRGEMSEKFRLEFTPGQSNAAFQHHLVVASIDTAKRTENAAIIHGLKWDLVVVDEAHHLKNKATINWAFVNSIEKKYLLLLTATPMQNDLRELYNLITLLKPGQLKTYTQFKQEFMLDRHSPKNLFRLRELLGEVMVRRSRRETLIHFPNAKFRRCLCRWSAMSRCFTGGWLIPCIALTKHNPRINATYCRSFFC
jgi:SNF2 family DNA or RNA helicase